MKSPYKILKGLPVIYVNEDMIIYGPNVYKKCGKAIDLNDWPEAKKQWEGVINGSGDFTNFDHDREKKLCVTFAALGFIAGASISIIISVLL